MRTVTIRELHSRTGELVRQAGRVGEVQVTDRGRVIARILPETGRTTVPYFSRRRVSSAFRRLDESGRIARGTDSTVAISEDREDRA